MSAVFVIQNNHAPQGNNPGGISNGNVIWGEGAGDNVVEEYGDQTIKGTIVIAELLKNAMTNSDNGKDLFAVTVTEMTGANPNDVSITLLLSH